MRAFDLLDSMAKTCRRPIEKRKQLLAKLLRGKLKQIGTAKTRPAGDLDDGSLNLCSSR
jgi:ATP-dependent DNA ligase